MANISIDDGREAITINGDSDRVIYIQTADFNIYTRTVQARKEMSHRLGIHERLSFENVR